MNKKLGKRIFAEAERLSKLDFDESLRALGALIESKKDIGDYYQAQNFSLDISSQFGTDEALAKIVSKLLNKFREQLLDLFNELGDYELLRSKGAKSVPEIAVVLAGIAINHDLAPTDWIVACTPIIAKELMEQKQASLASFATAEKKEGNEREQGKRYADFVFYRTNRLGRGRGESVSEGYALNRNKWYVLEVAVRPEPIGIPHETDERLGIVEPKVKQDVRIYVTAEGEDFEIKENVQVLVLPPSGESKENAFFRVRPRRKSLSRNDLLELTVRLYYNFNQLEVALIKAEVIGENDLNKSNLGLTSPITFKHVRLECEVGDFSDIKPRKMHITVSKIRDQYHLSFLFPIKSEQEIVFTAPIRLRASDLEDELVNVRTVLHRMQVSKFAEQLEGDFNVYPALRELAKMGAKLWSKVFHLDINSSLYWIGEFLKSNPIIENGIIQISVDDNAKDFVFPWSLLYDREIQETSSNLLQQFELPDPKGFWGIRYQIEQHLPSGDYTDEPIPCSDGLDFDFMLGSILSNIEEQKQMLASLVNQSNGKLRISDPPITKSDDCFSLLENCNSEILYFYSHGYTRPRRADIGVGDGLQRFLKILKERSETDPVFQIYKPIFDEIMANKFDDSRSWIQLASGRLYLDDLRGINKKFNTNPIVILNMCESAQVIPSLSESFIDFFIDRGASCVIGTECPMTTAFAHPFSEMLLKGLLQGETTGEVLLKARRHFLCDLKNPLGLAYTLYGSAGINLSPKLI